MYTKSKDSEFINTIHSGFMNKTGNFRWISIPTYYNLQYTIGEFRWMKNVWLKRIFNNDDDHLCLKLSRCEIAQIKEGDDRK